MAAKHVKVFVRPEDLEPVSWTFNLLNASPLGQTFEFLVETTYLTPKGSVVVEWPKEIQEHFDRVYATKRPINIPLIVQ